jgi:N utilization substance protein B
MENKTLKYTNARLLAVQAVYAQAQSGEDWNQLISRFLLEELGGTVLDGDGKNERVVELESADKELFAHLTQYVRDNETALVETIQSALSDSVKAGGLDLVLSCVLKVGVAEFYVNPDLDTPIIINEYVDLTRSFYDGPEVKIVNAVLDKIAHVLRG